jgi:hypothetical protein
MVCNKLNIGKNTDGNQSTNLFKNFGANFVIAPKNGSMLIESILPKYDIP